MSSDLRVLLITGLVVVFCGERAAGDRPEGAAPASFAERRSSWERNRTLARESVFCDLEWRSVGPVRQGARVVDIEVVPGGPYRLFVAYASGGLWRSENNGHTFTPVIDDLPTVIVGDVAIDPSRPATIWLGTGESNSSRSSYGGYGVFRSEDGGSTWRHMGLGESDRIGRICIDPRDSNRIYVAALGKLYTPGGERGVYRSTDGGETWRQVLAGGAWSGACDLILDPQNPDVIYAATWERSRRPWNFVESGTGSAIWKSTDGGDSWTSLDGGLPEGPQVGRIGLAICRDRSAVVYACIDNQEQLPEELWDLGGAAVTPKRLRTMTKAEFLEQDPDVIEDFIRANDFDTTIDAKKLIAMVKNDEITIGDLIRELDDANARLFETDIRGLELYRSDDAGATWRRTHEDPLRQVVHTYGYYFGVVEVAPDNPERVYIAGVPLLRSDDGGRTFKNIMGRNVHVDHHALWIDPAHPDHIIVGNDGGLDVSYDAGETWRRVDAQAVGQFYTVAVDRADPYNIYGGLQDNGVLKGSSKARPGIDEWSFIGGGDGMYVQVDSRDGTVYFGYQFGYYTRVDPDGSRHTVRPRDALREAALRYNWSTPIQLSEHNQDILYYGANRLYRSMDRGDTWSAISPDLSRSGNRGDVPYACITTLSESTLEFGLIWIGTDDGEIWVTEDGGKEWRSAVDGVVADRWVSRVEASRHVRERAYLSLSGYRDDDIRPYLYVTDDLGASWRSIADGLPAEPINVVREDPVNGSVVYVGTDRSCYVSLDGGKGWLGLGSGLPSVPVHDLVVHPLQRELVAATHGRSVYVLDALPVQELTPERMEQQVVLFPQEDVQYSRSWRRRRSLWFHRSEDDPERSVPFWSSGEGTAKLEVLDGDSHVLRVMEKQVDRGIDRFTWDLLLDPELALPVEREREERRARESSAEQGQPEESATEGRRARVPWSEAVRLGHPLYITPGEYQLRVSWGGAESSVSLKVKEPEPRKPRSKKKPRMRGEKRDDERP